MRVSSYDAFLKDLMQGKQIAETAFLSQVVRDIITVTTENTTLMQKLLTDLNQTIDPADQRSKSKYRDLTNDETALNRKLETLVNSQKNWEAAREADIWFVAARRVMLEQTGEVNAWAKIESKYTQADVQYLEIRTIAQSIKTWDSELKELNSDYFDLINSYAEERFSVSDETTGSNLADLYGGEEPTNVRSCTNKIGSRLSSLPDFSLSGAHTEVIQKLADELEVRNSYNGIRVKSLENIEATIPVHQNELDDWEKYEQNEQKLLAELSKNVGNFKAMVANFQGKYTEVKQFLNNQDKEKERLLKVYLDLVNGLSQGHETTVASVPDIPMLPITELARNDSITHQAAVVDTQKRTGFGFLQPKKKTFPPAMDPLVEAVRSSAGIDFPLCLHSSNLVGMVVLAGKPADGKPGDDSISSKRSWNIQLESAKLVQTRNDMRSQLMDTVESQKVCMEKWPFPETKMFKNNLDKRQYNNLGSTIIEADMTGPETEEEKGRVKTYREILVSVRGKQKR